MSNEGSRKTQIWRCLWVSGNNQLFSNALRRTKLGWLDFCSIFSPLLVIEHLRFFFLAKGGLSSVMNETRHSTKKKNTLI